MSYMIDRDKLVGVSGAAIERNVEKDWIRQLLRQGRIVGAWKLDGHIWIMPSPVEIMPPERPRGRPRKV